MKRGRKQPSARRGRPRVPGKRPDHGDPLADLIAQGKIIPATKRLSDIGPPLPAGPGPTLSEILAEMRAEKRW